MLGVSVTFKYNDMMDYMQKPINHYLIIVVRLVNYLGYLVESLFFNRQNSRNVGNSLGVLSTGQLQYDLLLRSVRQCFQYIFFTYFSLKQKPLFTNNVVVQTEIWNLFVSF